MLRLYLICGTIGFVIVALTFGWAEQHHPRLTWALTALGLLTFPAIVGDGLFAVAGSILQ